METRARVSETLLAGAEGPKVGSGLWHNIIIESEVDAAALNYREQKKH